MRSKLFFLGIAAFWVTMTYLLWQSQSAAHSAIGSAVPVEVVWDKILTAPDNSSLDIYDHDKRIGYCEWTVSSSGSQALTQALNDDYSPSNNLAQPIGYTLNLDGNSALFSTNRIRFELHLRLSPRKNWQDLRASAKLHGLSVETYAVAAQQKVLVKAVSESGRWQRWLKFSELEHPEALLAEVGAGDLLSFIGLPSLPISGDFLNGALASVKWEAHEDWMQFGHSRVQVYRLDAQFFGQHIYVFTSRVGEILWVEVPNKLTMRNEAFGHF